MSVMQINGAALEAVRELQGYSQAELSRRSGVAQSRVSKFERSGTPVNVTMATLRKLAETLRVKPAALMAVPEDVAS